MCWNEWTSATTGAIALGIGAFLWLRNEDRPYDRWVAVLATAIGSMQFVELVMWLDQSCTGWNEGASVFAFILLTWIHPFVSLFLAYYYWFKPSRAITSWRYDVFLLWSVLTVAWSVTRTTVYPPTSEYTCTRKGEKHLDWDWDRHLLPSGSYVTLYYLFTFVPLLAQGTVRGVFWLVWSAAVSSLASLIDDDSGGGSMYCWLGSISGLWQVIGVPRWLSTYTSDYMKLPEI